MCAIAGLVGLPIDRKVIGRMLETMFHRGPDQKGVYQSNTCTLLHSRLTIIDPEGGVQPMELEWEGENYTLVYNGELYNTEELRKELQVLGHSFCGYSDTEVLLHAYVQWKEGCLQKLNGIFGFAVWHARRKRLFLGRDRMGVKPLFYMPHKNGLLFASEIKTILSYPSVQPTVDKIGMSELLLLGPGRRPGSGVFRGIFEIEPGWYGVFENGKMKLLRYWSLQDREHTESFDETVEHTRYLVEDAICRQTVSDVPFGTFLSGGLDSSIITAVCAKTEKEKGRTLSTFSVDYKNNNLYFTPGKFQPESDNAYIELMRQEIGVSHTWTVLSPEDLWDALKDATIARDLPGMADVDFSLLQFCRQIRGKVKMALSGECADEIFGGYPWYRDPEIRATQGFPWAQNTKYRASFLQPDVVKAVPPEEFVYDSYRQTIDTSDVLPGASPEERRIKEMVNLNHRWFMQTLLDRKDRMSMYSGLEVRVPFCDYRIAEYLYGVPWKFKEYGGVEKGLLRKAFEGVLPEEILWRKKSPYPKTYDPGYMSIVSEGLRGLLDRKEAPIFEFVRKEALQGLLDAEYQWPWYGQLMKVPQTIAYILQIDFWLNHYDVQLM